MRHIADGLLSIRVKKNEEKSTPERSKTKVSLDDSCFTACTFLDITCPPALISPFVDWLGYLCSHACSLLTTSGRS
jgi:hypothetical protein